MKNDGKILVAYYSYSGTTRRVAEEMSRALKCDLFEIVPEKAYPADYSAVVAQAKAEISAGVKPTLKEKPPDLSGYSAVVIGSPNWWNTMAPPAASFLASGDFAGKRVALFVTHGGGGLGRASSDATRLCPGADILAPISIRDSEAGRVSKELSAWLRGLGLLKPGTT